MTYEITESNVSEFLAQFCQFYDAVVRRIVLGYGNGSSKFGEVEISCRKSSDDDWTNVILRVDGLQEAKIQEGRATIQVLSDGLLMRWFHERVYVVIAPHTSRPEGIEDIRAADAFFAGESCSWRTIPYRECLQEDRPATS